MRPWTVALGALAISASAQSAVPQPYLFRQLTITIEARGDQNWSNPPQFAATSTEQRYRIKTSLRSTGKYEGANLLDPDLKRRSMLKAEYLRRSGMAQIRAAGIDPSGPGLEKRLQQQLDQQLDACGMSPDCIIGANARFAPMIMAAGLPDNSAMFSGEARYLFFFGYRGCQNEVQAIGELHLKGEATRTGKKGDLKPFVLDIVGESEGTPEERRSLCERITLVLDTKTKQLQVENVYFPAAVGVANRIQYGGTSSREQEVPLLPPLQGWANEILRNAPVKGSSTASLPLTLPLDGDSSVLGSWDGRATVSIQWSLDEMAPPSGGSAQ
jgi:hypothetical protein